MRILYAASECYPLIKTGGLADVVGALPLALNSAGDDVRILLPGFPAVLKAAKAKKKLADIEDLFGAPAKLYSAKSETGLKLFIIDAPKLFAVDGNPYQDGSGKDREDNHIRFAALSWAAAELASGSYTKWTANIVHAHDWQAGLVPAYLRLKGKGGPKTVFTIHNLAFQGLFPKSSLSDLRIPKALYSKDGVEYWDKISFLKAGIVYSDAITTVSPSYAGEIQTEELGMGLGGLLKAQNFKLQGILNGIDTEIWNPQTDPAIQAAYGSGKMAGKKANKKALQKRFGLRVDAAAPLFCVISRLTEQKGLDLVAAAIPHIIGNGGQLMVLGTGEKNIEAAFEAAAKEHKGMVATFIGYDEPLAHQVQAAADAIFIPSRFEPCGLTQLCAMRYGTLPIVSSVGGLADTVIDTNEAALQMGAGTGLQFSPVGFDAFCLAVDRFLKLFDNKKQFARIQRNAMKLDVSWAGPSKTYGALYENLISKD